MPPRKKKVAAGSVGPAATEVTGAAPPAEVKQLAGQIADDGGTALASYRDPYAAQWVVMAALPLDKVEPTPYQRELSDTHAKRLADVIPKVGRFLDPIIAVRHDGVYWSPNGMHRLAAMKRLGARAITALVLPEPEVAYRILALNTEKAHNLKDKSLEVIRMAKGLAEIPEAARKPERDYAFEFEEAAYPTIGLCYEQRARFSGGVYLSVVKRCEEWSDKPLKSALVTREKHADKLLALDDEVIRCVAALKQAGLTSAYLKAFVVARINPLRFVRAAKPGQPAPRADFDGTFDKMMQRAAKFDATKIKPQDIAASGGAPAEEE